MKATLFSENYTKFYFDTKHLEKGLIVAGGFLVPFFQKGTIYGQYRMLSWISQNIPCEVLIISVFKPPHSLLSSLLNERSFWIMHIDVFCDNLGQGFTKVLWILNPNHSGGFLKVTLLWVLFWKCHYHYISL